MLLLQRKRATTPLIILLTMLLSNLSIAQSAYIPNYGDNTVSVVNLATNTVSSTIAVGNSPFPISVSFDGSKVYVGNTGANSISVINTSDNTVITTIPLGFTPAGICVSPNGKKLYVSKNNSQEISVISTQTQAVLNTIQVGTNPKGIAITPDGKKIYVANSESQTISVIDSALNDVTATILYFAFPWGLCMSPDGAKLYATNTGSAVAVVNTSTDYIITNVTTPSGTDNVAISANGHRVCATSSLGNSACIIDPNPIYPLYTASVTNGPSGVDLNSDGTRIYVVSQYGSFLQVINTATYSTVATIPLGNYPIAFGRFIAFDQQVGNQELRLPEDNSLAVYPNPSSDQIHIEFEKNQSNSHIQLLNLNGELIGDYPFSGTKLIINSENLSSGTYLLKIQVEGGELITKKVVVN